jgi:C1q domain
MSFASSYYQIDSPDPINSQDLATKHYRDMVGLRASCRYGLSAFTTSATAMTIQTIVFNILFYDDANAYNTTTGMFTCPYPGVYMVTAQYGLNITAGVQVNRYVWKNGLAMALSGSNYGGYNETAIVWSDRCVAGDALNVSLAVNQASVPLRTGTETGLDIVRMGP